MISKRVSRVVIWSKASAFLAVILLATAMILPATEIEIRNSFFGTAIVAAALSIAGLLKALRH